MLWNKQKLKTTVVACFLALTLATNDFSFGSTQQLHFVLEQIAPLLGATGIDVFCCDAAQARGERPRVGLLEDMRKASFEHMPEASLEIPWVAKFRWGTKIEEEFRQGRIGIISIDAPSEAQFRSAWDQALQNRKVFLSFTRADLAHANKIKEALESKGYKVFTYLNEEAGPPKYPPEFAGRMFKEAGLRLVLDTPAARESFGVWLEARLDEELRREARPRREPLKLLHPKGSTRVEDPKGSTKVDELDVFRSQFERNMKAAKDNDNIDGEFDLKNRLKRAIERRKTHPYEELETREKTDSLRERYVK